MRILMKETHRGSANGVDIQLYEAGKEYPIQPRLAKIFISAGWADEIPDKPEPSKLSPAAQKAKADREKAIAAQKDAARKAAEETAAAQKKADEDATAKKEAEEKAVAVAAKKAADEAAKKAEEEKKPATAEKVPADKAKAVVATPEKKVGVN